MRALVVGGSGQIGGWLLRVLAERGHIAIGTYHKHLASPGLVYLDASLFDEASETLFNERPDVIFYPAGFTWVDGCENSPDLAYSANLRQPLNLARAAGEIGARFVYFSTDYVFDGRAGPYDEGSPTNPLSVYGRAKRDAELAMAEELGERAIVVRTSWVFGPERQGKNFAYQLVKALGQGKTLDCPADQISSPSYGPDVARAVVGLVDGSVSGLIHIAGPEVIGRVEFARAIAGAFGLDPSKIIPKTTAELAQVAPRPLNGGLLTSRPDVIRPGVMRPLTKALADFKARLSAGEGWTVPG